MGPTFDVVIIGGGVAGLSAALLFGRSRRKVLVVDGEEPRNRFADHSHGFFTRDGTPPLELLEIGRSQLLPYPSVQLLPGFARSVSGTDGHFTVQVEKKEGKELQEFTSRKILLATGVRDLLPELPGLKELWGGAVFHCPYCHGWEVRDQKIAVLCELPVALDITLLLRGWSKDITFLSNGPAKFDEAGRKTLEALKIPVIETKVTKLEREGTNLKGVIFEDGSQVNCTAMLLPPLQVESSGLAEALGCAKGPTGHLETQFGKTSVAGVFAAGDINHFAQTVTLASGRGVEAAIFLNKELSIEDTNGEVAAGAN